jgi:murein DD-endopeptidase MepM/ murein hydrolase activator NlpD
MIPRLLFAVGLLLPAALAAQAPRVTTTPARPIRGQLFSVVVRVTDSARIDGEVAGEPLHFRPVPTTAAKSTSAKSASTKTTAAKTAERRYSAIAAAPIDGSDTLALRVVVRPGTSSPDTIVLAVRTAPGNYRTETLRVAPEFGREPDSALAKRIADEGAKARAIGVASHDTPRLWREAWRLPRPGRVTSGFGTARTFNGAVQSRHMGVDFAGATGTPIRAANRGVVALVADFYLAGRAVYVDHGDGLVTGYFHMSRADVSQGDTVARGQVIGRVGQSGRVTGPHLHWVMRSGGVSVDPRSVLGVD